MEKGSGDAGAKGSTRRKGSTSRKRKVAALDDDKAAVKSAQPGEEEGTAAVAADDVGTHEAGAMDGSDAGGDALEQSEQIIPVLYELVKVFWPKDNAWYSGQVVTTSPLQVLYTDGELFNEEDQDQDFVWESEGEVSCEWTAGRGTNFQYAATSPQSFLLDEDHFTKMMVKTIVQKPKNFQVTLSRVARGGQGEMRKAGLLLHAKEPYVSLGFVSSADAKMQLGMLMLCIPLKDLLLENVELERVQWVQVCPKNDRLCPYSSSLPELVLDLALEAVDQFCTFESSIKPVRKNLQKLGLYLPKLDGSSCFQKEIMSSMKSLDKRMHKLSTDLTTVNTSDQSAFDKVLKYAKKNAEMLQVVDGKLSQNSSVDLLNSLSKVQSDCEFHKTTLLNLLNVMEKVQNAQTQQSDVVKQVSEQKQCSAPAADCKTRLDEVMETLEEVSCAFKRATTELETRPTELTGAPPAHYIGAAETPSTADAGPAAGLSHTGGAAQTNAGAPPPQHRPHGVSGAVPPSTAAVQLPVKPPSLQPATGPLPACSPTPTVTGTAARTSVLTPAEQAEREARCSGPHADQ